MERMLILLMCAVISLYVQLNVTVLRSSGNAVHFYIKIYSFFVNKICKKFVKGAVTCIALLLQKTLSTCVC
jgi:hypothetical protein